MGMPVDQQTKEDEGKRLASLIANSRFDSQADFARSSGVRGGKSMLSQNIKGVRPISLEAGIAYANCLNVSISEFSPRLASKLLSLPNRSGDQSHNLKVGEREATYQDADISILIEQVKKLSADDARLLLPVVASLAKRSGPGSAQPNSNNTPLFGGDPQAATGT